MAARQYAAKEDMLTLFGAFDQRVQPASMLAALLMATAYVENQTRRILSAGTYTENKKLIVNKDYEIVVPVKQWPITGVTAVSWYYTSIGASGPPVTVADLSVVDYETPPTRFIYIRNQQVLRYTNGRVSVTYSAGFSPIPEDIVLATCLVAQEILLRQINPFGSVSISTSAGPASNSLELGQRSLNLQLADQLLQPYQAWE